MLNGIDVSHWQGVIDWPKVKAAGVQFAFIKASEGNGWVDDKFVANWNEARAVGIPRGAYHFWRKAYSGDSQAAHFLKVVGSDSGELPLVVDVEDTVAQKDAAGNAANLNLMLVGLGDRKKAIYTGKWYWDPWFGSSAAFAKVPLWVAHYSTGTAPYVPTGWTSWLIWQYTSSGRVDGISGNVDMNRAWEDLLGAVPPPPGGPTPVEIRYPKGTVNLTVVET